MSPTIEEVLYSSHMYVFLKTVPMLYHLRFIESVLLKIHLKGAIKGV